MRSTCLEVLHRSNVEEVVQGGGRGGQAGKTSNKSLDALLVTVLLLFVASGALVFAGRLTENQRMQLTAGSVGAAVGLLIDMALADSGLKSTKRRHLQESGSSCIQEIINPPNEGGGTDRQSTSWGMQEATAGSMLKADAKDR